MYHNSAEPGRVNVNENKANTKIPKDPYARHGQGSFSLSHWSEQHHSRDSSKSNN